MYATCIEPLHCDDPRSKERSRHNRIARDALNEAGIKPHFESRSLAVCERHAHRMNEVLEPLGRSALVSNTQSIRIGG